MKMSAITIDERIEKAWNNLRRPTDWLGLESTLRAILRDDEMPADVKVTYVDEALAAFTGRGRVADEQQPKRYDAGHGRKVTVPEG